MSKRNGLVQSSDSCNGIVSIGHPLALILVIDGRVIEVIVVLVVYGTVDNWLHHVDEEKCWYGWEHKSHPVTRKH